MDLREIGYEDGRWMELAQDRVQWQAVLNLLVLLPECSVVCNISCNGDAVRGHVTRCMDSLTCNI